MREKIKKEVSEAIALIPQIITTIIAWEIAKWLF